MDEDNKKYKFTGEKKEVDGRVLYQIEAIRDFNEIEAGTLGGFIEKEWNLSSLDNAWVYKNAMVYGNANIGGNASVAGNSKVYGNSSIYGNAMIRGDSEIGGYADICENSKIYENINIGNNYKKKVENNNNIINKNKMRELTPKIIQTFTDDERELYRAGLLDENKAWTITAKDSLVEMLLEERKEPLVKIAKEIIKEEREAIMQGLMSGKSSKGE